MEGAEIVKAMKDHAETTVLVADSHKYGKIGFTTVLPLTAMDLILTDGDLAEPAMEVLRAGGINIRRITAKIKDEPLSKLG
jgi:DeoR/GlpR family transcriptional regulator of sugar metabolism